MTRHVDVLVVGAGPAGLTAGIYLARAKLDTLIVDSSSAGGQLILSHEVANYPGVPETTGAQLARTMARQAKGFGCEVITQTQIESMDLTASPKRFVIEDEGEVTATSVILALGGRPRTLGIPSEEHFRGTGISYCATCDGDFFTDKEIVTVGGGNSAIEESIALTKWVSKVTVVHEFDHFQAQSWLVEEARRNPKISFLMEQDILRFEGEGSLERVVTAHKQTREVTEIPARGCFIFIGYLPNTEEIRSVVTCDEWGAVMANEAMETNVPGVFVAGDARAKRYRQITTATADGTIAAQSAIEYVASLRD